MCYWLMLHDTLAVYNPLLVSLFDFLLDELVLVLRDLIVLQPEPFELCVHFGDLIFEDLVLALEFLCALLLPLP